MPEPTPAAIDTFIERWENSGGHERGAGHQFLLEFCDLLGLDKPTPPHADNERNSYTFERRVERKRPDGSTTANWIDLYKSGCFVLETKQGVNPQRDKSDPNQPLLPDLVKATMVSAGHGKRGSSAFDKALERAHAQGERYIHSLPAEEGRPPFLIVCDVGYSFDLYTEFSGTGGQYERFPDPRNHRIHLKDLHKQKTRDLLRKIWSDPRSLDPSKHAAEVTREVAKALAELAKSLEKDGHDPQVTAGFLQRCLFTMFAEDVELLPKDSFVKLLHIARESPAGFPVLLNGLWKDMDKGTDFSAVIHTAVIHFNGGLFHDSTVLPLRPDQITYLIHAAKQDWSQVEPAIFGTLLERALDPKERHKLGAHYTPRSYVERLVRPTLIDPLREKWEAVRAAAAQLEEKGKIKEARATVETFHKELAAIRVLDPACGSGNFLYVSLELIKRLEAEVLDLFEKLGGDRALEMHNVIVRPDNFLGIELNARAAAIAQIVLWIGYFQFHRRATGKADTNDRPLLPKKNTIENRDAVLAYDERIPRKDEEGNFVTIWDGRTTKPHPVTGKEVPDESARTNLFDYTKPRRAEWPEADYIVGNPPFIGNKKMIEALGDGYTESLRKAWKGKVPDSADFVMYWWQKAAELLAGKKTRRFGFITTNSIHQTFNRRVLEPFLEDEKKPVHLAYAIPDHPWVDSADGAAVRISMTVATQGIEAGVLEEVIEEVTKVDGENEVVLQTKFGLIAANLLLGADTTSTVSLKSNSGISCLGLILGGKGFKVQEDMAEVINAEAGSAGPMARPIWNGSDVTDRWSGNYAIDAFGLTEAELVQVSPTAWQHLKNTVYDIRQQNRDPKLRKFWWLFRRANTEFRSSTAAVKRFVVTSETAKHRIFRFLGGIDRPEHKLVVISSDDAFTLGTLSSSIHVQWSVVTGSWLGVGNDSVYVKSRCFEPFPFPALEEGELKTRIRELGECLDAHRKGRQAAHPGLTLTGMYNVLEKLRAGEALSDKDKKIHDEGLVTVLKQIHDDLDAAVYEAYGWEDLHQAQLALAKGSLVDPETGLCTQIEAGSDTDLAKTQREHAEKLEQILLTRLVSLNHERAAEEKQGLVRWLRPEYQAPEEAQSKEIDLPMEVEKKPTPTALLPDKLKWPKGTAARFGEVTKLLPATGADAEAISACFGKKSKARIREVEEILETLKSLGKLE
ncbi:MAG: DNA methyltransferase [Luteolibacter sp.]